MFCLIFNFFILLDFLMRRKNYLLFSKNHIIKRYVMKIGGINTKICHFKCLKCPLIGVVLIDMIWYILNTPSINFCLFISILSGIIIFFDCFLKWYVKLGQTDDESLREKETKINVKIEIEIYKQFSHFFLYSF